jgi:hypothetical protein
VAVLPGVVFAHRMLTYRPPEEVEPYMTLFCFVESMCDPGFAWF